MNVYRFEMKTLLKSTLGWTIALCGLMLVYLLMYPIFRDMGFDITEVFSKFPPTLQALFGMEGLAPDHFSGYLPFPIKLAEETAAIGGLVVGTFAAAHDSRQKCADFLFAKPISRTAVMGARVGAVVTVGAVIYLSLTAFLLIAACAIAPGERFLLSSALASAAIPALIFLLYACAGLLLGVAFPKVRGTAAIGIGSMFFSHIVFSVGKIATKNPVSPVVRATVPVCMFDRGLAAGQGVLEWPFLLLWGCEAALFLVLAFAILRRRDIV